MAVHLFHQAHKSDKNLYHRRKELFYEPTHFYLSQYKRLNTYQIQLLYVRLYKYIPTF